MENHPVFNHSTSNYIQYNSFRYKNISTINLSQIARKRTLDDTNIMNMNNINVRKKKMKLGMSSDEQPQLRPDIIQFQTHKVMTERKSHKLSDKITALQKLVSPYGKTDTASVLEEAFISIIELQIQIKNMSLMFMSNNQESEKGDQMELQRMGLCLVPFSVIHSNTKFNEKSLNIN